MRLLFVLFSFLSLIILSACSSSYEELSNNFYNPPTKFTKHLMDEYKTKANFEAIQMHDWNSTKLYSEKALAAAKGKKIKPEKINYWKIPLGQVKELQKAYENLMIVYNDAIITKPYHLALAISSLDCWSEQQEENWQTWDILKCKEDYLNAMHEIYNALEVKNKKDQLNKETNVDSELNKETNTDSASIITKNNNEEILHIVYFDFDKSNLSEVSRKSINNFIEKNKDNISRFIIVGHTDTKGTKEYNMNLSLQRAMAVKNLFIDIGIGQENIKILAEGENKLLVQTLDEVAHPANRRAEISPLN